MGTEQEMAGVGLSWRGGGRVWWLTPLTLRDMAEFTAWAEEQFEASLTRRLERFPEAQRSAVAERAWRDLESGLVATRAMFTVAGAARLWWLCLRTRQPEITPEAAAEMVSVANLREVRRLIDKLCGREAEGGGDPPAGQPPANG